MVVNDVMKLHIDALYECVRMVEGLNSTLFIKTEKSLYKYRRFTISYKQSNW